MNKKIIMIISSILIVILSIGFIKYNQFNKEVSQNIITKLKENNIDIKNVNLSLLKNTCNFDNLIIKDTNVTIDNLKINNCRNFIKVMNNKGNKNFFKEKFQFKVDINNLKFNKIPNEVKNKINPEYIKLFKTPLNISVSVNNQIKNTNIKMNLLFKNKLDLLFSMNITPSKELLNKKDFSKITPENISNLFIYKQLSLDIKNKNNFLYNIIYTGYIDSMNRTINLYSSQMDKPVIISFINKSYLINSDKILSKEEFQKSLIDIKSKQLPIEVKLKEILTYDKSNIIDFIVGKKETLNINLKNNNKSIGLKDFIKSKDLNISIK